MNILAREVGISRADMIVRLAVLSLKNGVAEARSRLEGGEAQADVSDAAVAVPAWTISEEVRGRLSWARPNLCNDLFTLRAQDHQIDRDAKHPDRMRVALFPAGTPWPRPKSVLGRGVSRAKDRQRSLHLFLPYA